VIFNQISEVFLGVVVRIYHKMEKLTKAEEEAKEKYIASLYIPRQKNEKQVVVAMVGLIGSGKSSVAKVLANKLQAVTIEGDAIRIFLRKYGADYAKARKIAEDVTVHLVGQGCSVVLDSDFIDSKKRASIREVVKKTNARLLFVRTYCDYDVSAGRIIEAKYEQSNFFGGAGSLYEGKFKAAVVKLRELWRRTPLHYSWRNEGVGRFELRKLPFKITAEVDTTTDREVWSKDVEMLDF